MWDIFGARFGEVGYIISYAILVLIVFHILFIIYNLIERRLVKNEENEKETEDMLVA